MNSKPSAPSRRELFEELAPRLRIVLEAGDAFRKKRSITQEHIGYTTTRSLLSCLESTPIDYGTAFQLLSMFENQMVGYENELRGLEEAQGLLPQKFAAQTYQIVNALLHSRTSP